VSQSTGPASSNPSYRPEIDGLRAVAVLGVILNHFPERWLPGGYLGVDVFFVISGFVITASLARRPAEGLGNHLSTNGAVTVMDDFVAFLNRQNGNRQADVIKSK